MKTVLCFGTFDLLHLGHLYYFQEAKKYGDYLIVVIARDTTKQLQQHETIFNEQERLEMVQSLKIVDKAVLGNPENHFKIIEEIRPNVICLGYDHTITEHELQQKLSYHPVIKRSKPFKPEIYKSSKLKQRLFQK